MKLHTTLIKSVTCASVLLAASQLTRATDRTWVGLGGTTVINTATNWSGNATPSGTADRGIWDGTVITNAPFVWNGAFGPGGSSGAPIFIVSNYPSPFVLMSSAAGVGNLSFAGVTIESAGTGPFTFGSNGIAATTVWRGSPVQLINNSTNVATIAENVAFNNGSGVSRTVIFGGSGDWVVNSPFQPAGSGVMNISVDGTGANTLTLNAPVTVGSTSHAISNGTLRVTSGDALANSGTQTLTILGGSGIKRLALTNNIILNPAVANINIAGRDDATGATNAAIYNLGGDNYIYGITRFNAVGGTNVGIYNAAGNLYFYNNLTAANVTGQRFFRFDGPGTNTVYGTIDNGSATLGIRVAGGTVILSGANTYTGNTIIDAGVLSLGSDYALQNSTAVLNGGKLDIGYSSPYIGGLSGTGVIDTAPSGTSTLYVGNNNGNSSTFSGNITNSSGTVTLQKVGTNSTLTLSGASGYSGGTMVANGTLLVNNTVGSGTGSGNVSVSPTGTLGGTGRIAGSVNWQSGSVGAFSVTAVAGSNSTPLTVVGSVTLSGNSVVVDVPGITPLPVGTYKLMTYNNAGSSGVFATTPSYTGAGAELGTASTITTGSGQVTLLVQYTGTAAVWTNNGNGNWSTAANWSSNPNYPHLAGDAAILGVGSAYTAVTLDTSVSVGTMVFTNANSFGVVNVGNTLTLANATVDPVIAVQAGASNSIGSAVALNNNVTILASAGTALAMTNSVSNGSGTRSITINGAGTVELGGNNTYGPSAGTVGTTVGGGAVLQLGNNNALGAGDLGVASSSTIRAGAALTLANNIIAGTSATATVDNNGNNVTLSGAVSGAGSLAKNGTGTLTLSGANTHAGNTTVNAGTLKLSAASAIPYGIGYGNVIINTNGTLDLNGQSPSFNGLSGAGLVEANGTVTLTVGENDATSTFDGAIKNTTGSLTLVKNGTNTFALGGTNNTYSGGTTINAGVLQIGNGGTNSGSIGSGLITDNGTLQFNSVGTNTFSAKISGSGAVTLANTSQTLYLNGPNDFAGNVTINGGHLWITNTTGLGTGPKTVAVAGGGNSSLTTLHLAGGITLDSSYTLQLSYFGGALLNESGSNTVAGPIVMSFGGGASYINVKGGFLTLAGDVACDGVASGRTFLLGGTGNGLFSGSANDGGGAIGSLQKTNSGTWTVSGYNTSVAPATVQEGTLNLTGTWSGAVTVNSNATLTGAGYVGGNITYNAGAKAVFSVTNGGGVNLTPLTVAGSATLNNNTATINIPGATPLPAGAYTLMTYNATGTGAFASTPVITGAGIPAQASATVITGGGVVSLVVAPTFVWTNNGSGNWSVGANWSLGTAPGNVGDLAVLGVGSNLTTINLDGNRTVGNMSFTNDNSFVITNAANTLTLTNYGSGVTILVSAGASNAISTPVVLGDPNTTISLASNTSLSLNTNLSGPSGLTMSGNGTLTLSGSNSYAGVTTIGTGKLVLGSPNAIGANTLTIGSGNLDSIVPNLVNANNNPQNWNASFGFVGSQNLNLGTGDVTMGANVVLNVNSNTLTVGGTINGAFTLSVRATNNNNATLVLDGTNNFTGFEGISGTIALGSDYALGATPTLQLLPNSYAPWATNLTIMSKDATARTITNNVSPNSFDGPYNFGAVAGGTGDLNFTGTILTGNGQKRFYVNNTTYFSGLVADGGSPSGPIIKDGPGKLVVSGANAITKQWTLSAGTLSLGNATAIGTGALNISGGALDTTVANLVNAGNNAQNWNGSFGFVGSSSLDMGSGSVTLNANSTVTVSANTLTIGGAVSGAAFSLTKAGAGTLVLSGANTYSNTTVSAGTLQIAQATLATNGIVAVAGGGAHLQLNFITTNQVGGLVLNGVAQTNGVYGSSTPGGYLTGTGYLLVQNVGPSGPAQLISSVSGSTLSLSWPAGQGWRLQMQTNSLSVGLSTNWNYITDGSVSSTNINVDNTKPTVFYRLVYP
jgi:fibronectin-binding autotransporter adhesin